MNEELLKTGDTYGEGRIKINEQFSGTATFNHVLLDSGANFSGGTGGGKILSGGTDLYEIFSGNGASNVTASNGITKVASNIVLGGSLSQNTNLSFNGHKFSLSGNSLTEEEEFNVKTFYSPNEPSGIRVGSKGTEIFSKSTALGEARVSAANLTASMIYELSGNGNTTSIEVGHGGVFKIKDEIGGVGIQYDSNYHDNYTNRTLVDKEYVDKSITSASTTIENFGVFGPSNAEFKWDLSADSTFGKIILTGNCVTNLYGATEGQVGTLMIFQGGTTGSTTFGPSAYVHKVEGGNGGLLPLTLSTGTTDIFSFIFHENTFYWSAGYNYT